MTDQPTTSQVQQMLGLATSAAARAQLARWGIKRVGMTVAGEATWPGAEIEQRITARPGRGARTDLKKEKG